VDDITYINSDSLILSREVKKGMLEVNKKGQLIILDNNFNPMSINSRFIFDYGLLELHTNDVVDDYEKAKNRTRNINLITAGCVGVAALTVTAVQAYNKMKM
jgi:hypothetical protein